MKVKLVTFVIGLTWISTGFSLGESEDLEEKVEPLLEVYCFDCHNEKKKKGQIRLDDLEGLTGRNSHLWTKVYEQIESGEMPPGDKEQFSGKEKEEVLGRIVSSFENRAKSESGTRRRLNRREFSAALQELTGVPVDFGAGLAADGRVEGFDTGAEGLKVTPDGRSVMTGTKGEILRWNLK